MNFEMSVNEHVNELRPTLITVSSSQLIKWWTLNSKSNTHREIC